MSAVEGRPLIDGRHRGRRASAVATNFRTQIRHLIALRCQAEPSQWQKEAIMAEKLKVRRPTPEEGARLLRIVRRGHRYKATTYRRAMGILGSAEGNSGVKVLPNLVHTSPDRVRQVIHAFNEKGLDCLDPKWACGRPREIGDEDRSLIVKIVDQGASGGIRTRRDHGRPAVSRGSAGHLGRF